MGQRPASEFATFEQAVETAVGLACTRFGFCRLPVSFERILKREDAISADELAARIVRESGFEPLTNPNTKDLVKAFEDFFGGKTLSRDMYP